MLGVLKVKGAGLRLYSGQPNLSAAFAPGNAKPARSEDRVSQRELFMNVLNANATKRDAKQYLARFKPVKKPSEQPHLSLVDEERNARHQNNQHCLDKLGVNLGGLYAPGRAIAESPQFAREHSKTDVSVSDATLRVALVCLRQPQHLDDTALDGLALTLSQLVKLDMRIMVVLDVSGNEAFTLASAKAIKALYSEQVERTCRAISAHSPDGARAVDSALEMVVEVDDCQGLQTDVEIGVPKLIELPLGRGMIPVIPCSAHTASGKLVAADVQDVMEVLTIHFGQEHTDEAVDTGDRPRTAVDRIILLDQAGGIPSKDRGDGAHVFINLEQEFESITDELSEYGITSTSGANYMQHQQNLQIVERCLKALPSASSALIISPREAASASKLQQQAIIGTGTRRQKNTLIHNLLTNKPMVSSSLPAARLQAGASDGPQSRPANAATLVKRGMPLITIPAIERASSGWTNPRTGYTSLELENDPRVDFQRLLHLVEDSFRRKLDTQHYLDRIKGRIAGIIVAGEYEGGAILTWEQPRGTSDPSRLVPYLDKFAVLQSSQGSSGVADIVFQSMVRTCFPNGVCWRSRKDNPVNKWYFERAAGSWQIPETNWTMFWTGEGVVEDRQRWEDYTQVCKDVQPSWQDSAKPD